MCLRFLGKINISEDINWDPAQYAPNITAPGEIWPFLCFVILRTSIRLDCHINRYILIFSLRETDL